MVGPITQDLPSLIKATKVVLEDSLWRNDIDVIEMPWKEEVLQSIQNLSCARGERNGKLVFAVMSDDKFVKPHPPIRRAIEIVREALLERGYEVSIKKKTIRQSIC